MYNILICDDEKDIRAALRIYLTSMFPLLTRPMARRCSSFSK